jgi:hypothetical protein
MGNARVPERSTMTRRCDTSMIRPPASPEDCLGTLFFFGVIEDGS